MPNYMRGVRPYEVSFVVERVHGVPPYEGGGFILLSGSCFVLGWIDGGVSGAVGFISIYL